MRLDTARHLMSEDIRCLSLERCNEGQMIDEQVHIGTEARIYCVGCVDVRIKVT